MESVLLGFIGGCIVKAARLSRTELLEFRLRRDWIPAGVYPVLDTGPE